MKVKVEYTYQIAGDDLADLEQSLQEKPTRSIVRQILVDLGRLGIEAQIMQGYARRKANHGCAD